MKPTKLIVIVWAAQLAAARLVCAQDSPTPTPTVAAMLPPPMSNSLGEPSMSDILSPKLSLTDAQKTQLQPYFDAVQPQFNATHQQASQAEDVLLKQLSSIRPLLTPQQQTRLDTFEAMRIEGPPSNPVGVGVMFGQDFVGAVQ